MRERLRLLTGGSALGVMNATTAARPAAERNRDRKRRRENERIWRVAPLTPLLLLFALTTACQKIEHLWGAESSSASVAASAPDSSTVPSPLSREASCSKVRNCLAKIPHEYDPKRYTEIKSTVQHCMELLYGGPSTARGCPPTEIATDPRNGRNIEAFVTGVEQSYGEIRYAGVAPPECLCLGGHFDVFTDNYCVPGTEPVPKEDRTTFVIDDHQVDPRHFPYPRLWLLGFGAYRIRSINGKPVRDSHHLEAMVEALLEHPPAGIRSWQGDYGDKMSRQVSYVRRTTMDRLLALMSSLEIQKLEPRRSEVSNETPKTHMTVINGITWQTFSCDDQPSEDAKRRCFELAHAIETATETSAPSGLDPEPVDCNEVGRLSRVLSVWHKGGGREAGIEVRYVDWMAALGNR